jgi:hypothetical protein
MTTTERKRYFLKGLQVDAAKSGLPLRDVLEASFHLKYQEASAGQLVATTSVNGQSFTFLPLKGLSPDDCAHLMSELLNRFEDAEDNLVGAGNPEPTEKQIVAEMKRLLVPIRNLTHDYSEMRFS